MPEFRTGIAAIEEASNRSSSSSKFRTFAPSVLWTKKEPEKYVLVLTPIDEVVTALYHNWIPVGEYKKGGDTKVRYEEFLSRKDPSIGESSDALQDDLDRDPITRTIGIAVELDPILETVRGRERPRGFTAATRTFTRKTDDGDEEEVTTPKIGLIVQSPTFWKSLASLDAQQGPIEELPLNVVRENFDQDTSYTPVPFPEAPIDLSPVTEYLDGITYLTSEIEDLVAEINAVDDDENGLAAAQVVARKLLTTRLNELADAERYNELVGNIRYLPPPFSGGHPKFGAPQAASSEDKPVRKSQRDTASKPEPEPEVEADVDTEAEEKAAKPKKDSQKSRFEELKARIEQNK
jgi:hypothetical protein